MWNFERVLGAIGVLSCFAVGGFKLGYVGVFLVFATFVASCLYLNGKYAVDEDDELELEGDFDDE